MAFLLIRRTAETNSRARAARPRARPAGCRRSAASYPSPKRARISGTRATVMPPAGTGSIGASPCHGARAASAIARHVSADQRKPATRVREDRGIRTEEPEQLAEQQRRRDARGAGERRMCDDRYPAAACQRGEASGATDHGRDQNHPHAGVARFVELIVHLAVVAGQARRIDGAPAGVAIGIVHGALHRAHALRRKAPMPDRRGRDRP